jgi:hypothetical protein
MSGKIQTPSSALPQLATNTIYSNDPGRPHCTKTTEVTTPSREQAQRIQDNRTDHRMHSRSSSKTGHCEAPKLIADGASAARTSSDYV